MNDFVAMDNFFTENTSLFEDTESYLAALLFGSNSAAAQIGSRFMEVNPDA